jgi:pimeloyl-ACP methyl ester carboxylesterase
MIPYWQRPGMWAGRVPLPLVVAVAITATGCSPLVGVKHLSSRDANHAMTSNVLSTDNLSVPTRIALRRHNLLEQFDDKPADAIAQLHRAVVSEGVPNDGLFALAELSFFYAEKSRQTQYYLATVVYAFAYLFPDDPALRPAAMDPRYRWACDLYARSLTLGFETAKDGTVELRAGRYALPFGALDVASDEADLQWGNRRLKDFVPALELEVIGLRNRYETPGIGAPLTAATERTEASQSDLVGPFVRVPVTAVLLLDHPRQQLTGTEIHGTLRLIAANSAETITIGTETVPLDIDRTAPLATSLAASSLLETELSNFLGTATGIRGQSMLVARAPFQPGRIPVVFVHGTNSSPARWADMVNDLEANPWVRQHYQFWFFKYDSGNPILYSAMLLRRALKKAIQTYDPQGQDPCLQHMIVIGHSQGGLLTKMTVIDSGDRFWRNASDTPLDQLPVSEETRALLREAMFVEPLPFVTRVVFIATPHRGSYLAGPQIVRRLAQKLVSMPSTLLRTGADLFSRNDLRPYLKMQTLPTAIDNMAPGHPFIRTIAEIPVAPGVHAHSIIAVDGDGPKESAGDGVVKYVSAHIDGVESERIINSPHSCQSNPDTIDEVLRILRVHAADVSCGSPAPSTSASRNAVHQ